MAIEQTLYITKNSTFVQDFDFDFTNGDDFTGFRATLRIAKWAGSTNIFEVECDLREENGIIRASIADEDTNLLPDGVLNFSMYLVPPSGDKSLILNGKVVVIPTV